MSFPSMNANNVASYQSGAVAAFTGPWIKVPAVVEPDGMEFSFALGDTKAAASASVFTIVAEDGGSTGTASTVLFTRLTNSPSTGTAWTAGTARAVTGSSATDLDADDYVAIDQTTAGTAASGRVAGVAFVYGKPGAIA